MAGFCYSDLDSDVTASEKWSLITQPTSNTALFHNSIPAFFFFFVIHPILQLGFPCGSDGKESAYKKKKKNLPTMQENQV